MTGSVGYWNVSDIKKVLRSLLDAGRPAQQDVEDVGGGKLIASVKDTDGNIIGLIPSASRRGAGPAEFIGMVHRKRRDVFRQQPIRRAGKS
jgi:hypothetical protein